MRKRLLFEVASLVCLSLLQARAQSVPVPQAQVRIENVTFERVTKLTPSQRRDLAKELREQTDWPTAQTLQAVAGAVRQRVVAVYANNGYWRAKVEARVIPGQLSDTAQAVDVVIWAMNEGRQYRLRELRWSGVQAFPEAKLADLMPVHAGEVLERDRIVAGMDAAHQLYAAHGYLNYIALPEMQIDDAQGTVALHINVQEGGVFTFEKFDIVGMAAFSRERLLEAWPLRPGDVYPNGMVEDFLRRHASLLPPASPPDVVCRTLDLSNHTIEFVLDFRPQPQPCSSPEADTSSQTLNRLQPEP